MMCAMAESGRSTVATVFLRNRSEVLLLKRSHSVGTYPGRWGAVSGYVEGTPADTARREIAEETGLTDDVTHVRTGDPLTVENGEFEWVVHPFLFDADTRSIERNEESEAAAWVPPTEILRRPTVPKLWSSYDRVRPTPERIAADTIHGSAYLSIRALEVLRDEAGYRAATDVDPGTAWRELETVADDLVAAQPSMTAVTNRISRVMQQYEKGAPSERIEVTAIEEIAAAFDADRRAAESIQLSIDGATVLTLSRSGTVLAALRDGPAHVIVAESRPKREGVGVAEELAGAGVQTTLCTDAAVAWVIERNDVDAVLVGADTILADGSVVNKVGTRTVAIVATEADVPVYVTAAVDKISSETEADLTWGDDEDLYDGDRNVAVTNPIFDVTPPRYIAGYATDRGLWDVDRVQVFAAGGRDG